MHDVVRKGAFHMLLYRCAYLLLTVACTFKLGNMHCAHSHAQMYVTCWRQPPRSPMEQNQVARTQPNSSGGIYITLLLGHFCFSVNLTVHPRSLAGWLMGVGRCIPCFRVNAFLEVWRCWRPPSERDIGVPNFAKAPWHCYQHELLPPYCNGFKGSMSTPSQTFAFPHAIWSHPRLSEGSKEAFTVQHSKRLFTPASSLQKDHVDTKTLKFLQKCSQTVGPERKLARPTRTSLWPQVATTLVSNLKHTGRATNSKQKSVTAQSSATLLRRDGLYSVLESAKLFREACSNGTLALSPRDAFDYQKHGWLTGDAEGASEPNIWTAAQKGSASAALAKVGVAANMFGWAIIRQLTIHCHDVIVASQPMTLDCDCGHSVRQWQAMGQRTARRTDRQ